MDTNRLGDQIRRYREMRGLTQEELSQRIGVSAHHMSVLERGLKEPRLSTFLNLTETKSIPSS